MTALPDVIRAWQEEGRQVEIDGMKIVCRVEGRGPWLVCFHGFPTSSWDWHLLLPWLTPHRRVLVFDFPGYGLSAKPAKRDFSLLRQCEVAQSLMQHFGIERFGLLAHDMGNSVACELLYRRERGELPFELESLVLLNGGIYTDLHKPLLTQRLLASRMLGPLTARLSGYRVFRHQYPNVYADPDQFDEAHYRAQWALMLYNNGRRTLARIAVYMNERREFGERWTGPLERLDRPLEIIWGTEDPIAVPAIAEQISRRNPDATLTLLAGVGHYPQLEAPEQVSAQIVRPG